MEWFDNILPENAVLPGISNQATLLDSNRSIHIETIQVAQKLNAKAAIFYEPRLTAPWEFDLFPQNSHFLLQF